MRRIPRIFIHDESGMAPRERARLVEYVRRTTGAGVEGGGGLIDTALRLLPPPVRENKIEEWARKFARARVRDPARPPAGDDDPLPGVTAYERRRMTGSCRSYGVLYDGHALMRVYAGACLLAAGSPADVHVVLLDRLVGTYDGDDLRYHARVGIYGFPSLVSIPGVVEAPARSREYYLGRALGLRGEDVPAGTARGEEGWLVHEDPRIPEVLKGYVLQAVFFHATGDPFCPDGNCRLFNAHTQEELIRAQLDGGELCTRHRGMIRSFTCR